MPHIKRTICRKRIGPPGKVNNRPPKNWDDGYELVVSFRYGLDEDEIAKVAGLANYDTGTTLNGPNAGMRDLMFPCGVNRDLAYAAANRLAGADRFGALRIRISYPVEKVGEDSFTPWYDAKGKEIERVKHRKLVRKLVKRRRVRGSK